MSDTMPAVERPSPPTVPYATPTSEPSAIALGGLWAAFVTGVIFEALLYELQRSNNVNSGTVGTLLNPGEIAVVRVLMTILGVGLSILLYACVRYTRRFGRRAHGRG